MKRIGVLIVAFLSVICLMSSSTYAKSQWVPQAKPVVYKGIKFKPHFYYNAGVVEAFDVKTGKKVWENKVFDVKLDPGMELDIQWVVITSLQITDAGELLVADQTGKNYRVSIPNEILINS